MSSVTTPLCFSSTTPLTPLFTSSFQSPKKPLSLNIGIRQKKLRNDKVSMIKCSFHGNHEGEFHEDYPYFFGENEEKRQKITSHENLNPPSQIVSPDNRFTTNDNNVGASSMNQHEEILKGSGIPISLRIIKMKTRLMSGRQENVPVSIYSSAVKSISSVLLMIDKLMNFVCDSDLITEDSKTVSRETSGSLASLFKKIWIESPNLFLGIMNLITDLIVFDTGNVARDLKHLTEIRRNERCFDMGRSFYERRIVADPDNSLILGNYARYLYQNTNDKDRAEDYFVRAVRADPCDAETLSQYAMFLWHQKRDVEAAEDKLLAAIEADPQNNFHKSNYALFLWKTGASDTCFPLNPLA